MRVYSNKKMEAPSLLDGKEEELPLLFCWEVFVCNNTVEAQYYAAGEKPTKGGRVQTKYVCCHCYSDKHLQMMHTLMKSARTGQARNTFQSAKFV